MKKSQARTQAILEGRTTYIPEAPCRRGHLLRSTYGTCIECRHMREKALYHADPVTTKEKVAFKYRKNAETLKAKRRLAYAANREAEKAVAKVRSAEWRKNNPDHAGAKQAKTKWKQDNPGKVRADMVKRRAAKLQRTPAWLSKDDCWMLEQAYELAALRTKLFGFSWHVDHVLPLQGKKVFGLHVPTNVQVIPGVDNVRKANRFVPA
jgi:hypothetical protein